MWLRLVCLLALVAPAYAGPPPTLETIEWAVIDSDVVVRGTVVGVHHGRAEVFVYETIKGPRHRRLTVVGAKKLKITGDVLLFLRNRDFDYDFDLRARSVRYAEGFQAFDLREPKLAVSADLKELKTSDAILAAARRARSLPAVAQFDFVSVADDHPLLLQHGGNGGLIVLVPSHHPAR